MTVVDVSEALRGITESVSVTRIAAGSRTLGRWTDGSTSVITIDACVQPATDEDMQRLPEGQRIEETISIFTTTELKTVSVDGQTPADRVSYDGEVYEVQSVTPWSEVGGYYHVLAKRHGR